MKVLFSQPVSEIMNYIHISFSCYILCLLLRMASKKNDECLKDFKENTLIKELNDYCLGQCFLIIGMVAVEMISIHKTKVISILNCKLLTVNVPIFVVSDVGICKYCASLSNKAQEM